MELEIILVSIQLIILLVIIIWKIRDASEKYVFNTDWGEKPMWKTIMEVDLPGASCQRKCEFVNCNGEEGCRVFCATECGKY